MPMHYIYHSWMTWKFSGKIFHLFTEGNVISVIFYIPLSSNFSMQNLLKTYCSNLIHEYIEIIKSKSIHVVSQNCNQKIQLSQFLVNANFDYLNAWKIPIIRLWHSKKILPPPLFSFDVFLCTYYPSKRYMIHVEINSFSRTIPITKRLQV